MVKTNIVALTFILFCTSAYGAEVKVSSADAKPSEQSIKELLNATESQKLLDSMMGQMDKIMKAGIQEAFKGQNLTPKQKKLVDDMQTKMIAIFKQDVNWETLEPLFTQIYRESFTQQEVDGMLAFYKSPSGQAVIKKMPLVMQKYTSEMQKRMGPTLQKVLQMEEETIAEMKANEGKE